MAIGQFGRAGQKHDVQTVAAKLHNSIARRAFYHINLDAGMIFAILSYTARMTLEQENAKVSSSVFTRALTLDRLTPSAWAAWRKFRCSATASV